MRSPTIAPLLRWPTMWSPASSDSLDTPNRSRGWGKRTRAHARRGAYHCPRRSPSTALSHAETSGRRVVMPREALLARTLVELADSLVDDFDVVELLTRLAGRYVDLLDVAAAGLMLVAPEGDLRVVASSSEAMRVVELFEIQSQEGPCLDCYRTGEPVVNQDLATVDGRWRHFAPVALQAGFKSVHSLPMRLR